jgi:hypothetical protein
MSVRVLRLADPPLPAAGVLPKYDSPEMGNEDTSPGEGKEERNRELCLYRHRTVVVLRRYLRMALEAGRLPSLLGREFFRTRFSSYQTYTFEDIVVFVHDVERSLEELNELDQRLIAIIVLQEHSQHQAARLLGYTRRSVVRLYAEALDRVSEIFLRKQILERLPGPVPPSENFCQEAKNDEFPASHSEQGKNNGNNIVASPTLLFLGYNGWP